MGAVDVGVSIGAEHHQAGRRIRDQMFEQQQRRLVSPVHVVEYEQTGSFEGSDAEPRLDRLEEAEPLGARLVDERPR